MGKKRVSATKKKQLAKKNKLSSAYGVSVLKGGTIARNNGVLDSKLTSVDGSASAKRPSGALYNGEIICAPTSLLSAQSYAGGDNVKQVSPRQLPDKRRPRITHYEHEEFQHLHASLEERSLALQARQKEHRRMKKGRNNEEHTKGFGKFERPSSTSFFAPATLTLAPKTTQELVDDATNEVAQGMNEIGQHVTKSHADGASSTIGRSSLAGAASLNWKLRVSNIPVQTTSEDHLNNPFAALDNDSDSENSWGEHNPKVSALQFQFKPPTFMFQPTIPSMRPDESDVDPDL